MVDTYEVATGRTRFPPVILRELKVAMATAMAKATVRAANNLKLLQMLPELANDTLDMAPQAYRKHKLNFSHLIVLLLKVSLPLLGAPFDNLEELAAIYCRCVHFALSCITGKAASSTPTPRSNTWRESCMPRASSTPFVRFD